MICGVDEGIELLVCIFCSFVKDSIVFFLLIYGMYKVIVDIYNIVINGLI